MVSVIALTAYLAINVGEAALHHHYDHDAAHHESHDLGTCHSSHDDLPTPDSKEEGEDGEEHCLLCKVLHLAQAPSAVFRVDAFVAVTGDLSIAAALIRPHPLATFARSRAPPQA